MLYLWTLVDRMNCSPDKKDRYLALAFCGIAAAAGILFWAILKIAFSVTLSWLAPCIGYPAVIATVVSYIYICNHSFHNNLD